MGKRSSFPRRAMDSYDTPAKAVPPLLPFLEAAGIQRFMEPCAGNGYLVRHLEAAGLECCFASDIRQGVDALSIERRFVREIDPDAIISNPPWTRELMHPLIAHLMRLAPTWLLFDAGWMHTRQAAPYLPHCSHIVSVGRLRWIEDTPYSAKDDCCWYRFDRQHANGPRFFWREHALGPSEPVEKINMEFAG